MPFSPMAETVRCVGVERTSVKFQAKVMVFEGAILKKEVAVCGGFVIVRPPAGADTGMPLDEEVDWDWAFEALCCPEAELLAL